MKRFVILTMILVLAMSLSAAALAEPAQIASASVRADPKSELVVMTTVDLTGSWSVRFEPYTVYLYNHIFDPADFGGESWMDYTAYISFCSAEDYEATLAAWAEEGLTYEEKNGCLAAPYWDDMTEYIRPVDGEVYMDAFIFNTADADDVLARISCVRKAWEAGQ